MKPIGESVSLRGNIRVGPGTLTTTTGYVYDSTKLLDDVDASIIPYSTVFFPKENATVVSQEFVYATDKLGRFQDTSGVFIYYNEVNFLPLDSNNYLAAIWTIDKDYSYGVFTDGTYNITDKLSLEAGVRFSWEKRQAYANITGTLFGETLAQAQTQPPLPLFGQHIWTSVTPRVSIVYKATDQTNLYFTYSEGFKSGAFNTISLQQTPVSPETIDAFEIGAKNNFSRNLTLNVAAFYYDYKNLQISEIFQNPVTDVISSILVNAASSRIYGVEASGSWNATEDLGFDFGATYLNAHYSNFPNAPVLVQIGDNIGNEPLILPNHMGPNIKGTVMESSPTFTADLTTRYAKDTPVGHFSAAATVYFSTRVSFDVGDRVTQGDYATLNAFVAWRPVGSNVELKLWGKNLTNAAIISSTTIQNTADAVIYGAPRTYGIEASYKF